MEKFAQSRTLALLVSLALVLSLLPTLGVPSLAWGATNYGVVLTGTTNNKDGSYASLAAAIEAADGNTNVTISLTVDTTETVKTEVYLNVPENGTWTLDLAGQSLFAKKIWLNPETCGQGARVSPEGVERKVAIP